jgi:phosphoesterase RecJ-like protein
VTYENGRQESHQQVLQAIKAAQKFVLATHENPDGDALGSLSAMNGILTALGKDAISFMAESEFPLSYEYGFLQLERLVTEVPDDIEERTIIFLDCGNIARNPADALKREANTLNIDHHHDNTHFGTINLVVPEASCTAEIVWELMQDLGVQPTVAIAEALYVALVTDSGRFMYSNTTPRAHQMAGDLIKAGVDVQKIYRHLYEGVPQGKLDLMARGLANVQRFDDGLLTVTQLTREDFTQANADETHSEGLVDYLRAVAGTAVAGLIRELENGTGLKRKVSLRASDDRVDVSKIARSLGGGGHQRAAGFTTQLEFPELVEALRKELAQQL